MTAVYAGTFNPFTLGHLDIALRAAKIFDRLIIGVANDSGKNTLDAALRADLVRKAIAVKASNITVLEYNGLTTDFAKNQGARVIVRGIRGANDTDYELNLSRVYASLGDYETVTLFSSLPHISSTMVRQLTAYNVSLKDYVPSEIIDDVKKLYTP